MIRYYNYTYYIFDYCNTNLACTSRYLNFSGKKNCIHLKLNSFCIGNFTCSTTHSVYSLMNKRILESLQRQKKEKKIEAEINYISLIN